MEQETQSDSYRITADELRQFVERIEHFEAEKKDVTDRIKEVKAEARSRRHKGPENPVLNL